MYKKLCPCVNADREGVVANNSFAPKENRCLRRLFVVKLPLLGR